MPKKVELTELGKFFRKFRAVNDFDTEKLARALEVSPTMLYKIETGRRNPTQDVYYNFCNLFVNNPNFEFDFDDFSDTFAHAIKRVVVPVNNLNAQLALKFADKLDKLDFEQQRKIAELLDEREQYTLYY